ncbi:SGNH/GDSL hydrolase family protein [Clostridium sp. YIM B02505]|uniref:SGNH/GDSL hydrolase family protein n=1 Tax=Clostridium yunnanense TaxID=2800325 RepID=A0ABS1EUH7_9CLOT|nr:SGNH/GDSL hydrolase family protein [Clostridium yunnanense]MBK1813037.1 SGNH/GDSL hydrolase family protein [Clostridium yunnanense]
MVLNNGDIILFQGDSVTDSSRKYEEKEDLGIGYPMLISSLYHALSPDKEIKFINRGINGNRVKDLDDRWTEDCLSLNPTLVSILIGINNCWRRYDANDPTTLSDFKNVYRNILTRLKEHNNPKLILLEPFLLPVQPGQELWREDLDPKINAVRELARDFNATLIPLDGIFNQASTYKPMSFWTYDGVHPTQAGHGLIAKEWLKVVETL